MIDLRENGSLKELQNELKNYNVDYPDETIKRLKLITDDGIKKIFHFYE